MRFEVYRRPRNDCTWRFDRLTTRVAEMCLKLNNAFEISLTEEGCDPKLVGEFEDGEGNHRFLDIRISTFGFTSPYFLLRISFFHFFVHPDYFRITCRTVEDSPSSLRIFCNF